MVPNTNQKKKKSHQKWHRYK